MDVLLWSVRAVLIALGIILTIMLVKRRREGRFWEQYYISFFAIGITAFILGIILLILSSSTDLSFDTGLYITVVGIISFIVGLVIRNRWKKSR
jgi:uncharacterized membrane protein